MGQYPWPLSSRSSIATDLTLYLFLNQSGMPVPPELEARVQTAKAITFYIMGPAQPTYGNYWTTLDSWPEYTPRAYYLAPNRTLTTTPPTDINISPRTYLYDPLNPVDTVGGPELLLPCGPYDQTDTLLRTDVVVFTSEPFVNATPIVGPIKAMLYVSTNRNDTDFTVKLMDRYPNGLSFLVADGIVRLRWRDGPVEPISAVPGQVYNITVDLWPTAYVFEPGHAITVAVSSSNYPRFSINRNSGYPIADQQDGPILQAANTVYLDASRPSHIILPVVTFEDIPNNFTP